jgi:hypothetical protein
MTATDISFQNDLVNGGTAVTFYSGEVTKQVKAPTSKHVTEGTFDTVPVHKSGLENPRITIRGWILVSSGKLTANKMSEALLFDFLLAEKPTKLTVTYGLGGYTTLKGRPDAGYSVGGTMTNYMWCELESFSYGKNSQESEDGILVNVNLELSETHKP